LEQSAKRKADQQGQNAQHEAESVVKSFADCHMPLASTLPRSSAARESLLRRGTELEFHYLHALIRRRLILPALYRICRGIHQYRMSADHFPALHRAIGRHCQLTSLRT